MRIIVKQNKNDKSKAFLRILNDKLEEILSSDAYIGEEGMTINKKEGDKKTPIGEFQLGLAFGLDKKININKDIDYIQINENLYWIDDINSKYYNRLVDISKVEKDWNSAEHLIDYKIQYEYGIEIKTNPQNVKGMGSAIFLHCTNDKPTAGCIAIKKDIMKELLEIIDKDTIIDINI